MVTIASIGSAYQHGIVDTGTFDDLALYDALPDEVFAEFVTAVLGCAIAAPGT